MKRFQIITKPMKLTDLTDLAEIETREYEDRWLLKAEIAEHKRFRRFRRHLVAQ